MNRVFDGTGPRRGALAACALALVAAVLGIAGVALADGGTPPGDGPQRTPMPGESRAIAKRGARSPLLDGHGWMALPDRDGRGASGEGASLLVHLPPRVGGEEEGGGVVRPVTTLEGRVAGLAWYQHMVYAVMAEQRKGSQAVHRAYAVMAVRGAGSFYEYTPEGRAEVLPDLAQPGKVAGMAATPLGPVVLLVERAADGPSRATLWSFFGQMWEPLADPWAAANRDGAQAPDAGTWRLLDWSGGCALAVPGRQDGMLDVWSLRADGRGMRQSAGAVAWERRMYRIRSAEVAVPEGGPEVLLSVQGRSIQGDALLALWWEPSGVAMLARLRPVDQGGPILLGQYTGMPRLPATIAVPMDSPGGEGSQSGTVALVWAAASSGTTAATPPTSDIGLMLREVSAATGREMYVGEARVGPLVRRLQYQALVLLLLLVMVGVLVFVLRGDPQVVPLLPKGVQLAEPLRRLVSAMVDYAPSAVAVALLQGRSPLVLISPETILGGAGSTGEIDLAPIGMAIALTILHATFGEWLWGRSIGKFIAGIRVISIDALSRAAAAPAGGDGQARAGAGERPRFWQALVRNLVRWTVPLLAVFAMLDVVGRHPGDLAARTLVVADENDGS